jgi:streptomycin 6-kinase
MPEQLEDVQRLAERVRSALEAADLSAFGELLDPDVRWGAPGDRSPACQNRAQVLSWYQRGRDAGVRARVSEVAVLGDRTILVGLSVARNPAAHESGGEVERWQVLTVAAGRVVDIVAFDQRSEAIARAGRLLGPSGATWAEPPQGLADDHIEVRSPRLPDAQTLHAYASEAGGLEGTWVPLAPGASLASCEALVGDWQAGWSNLRGVQGPALAIVETGDTKLIGQVGFRDRGEGVVELVYGVAPGYRGRGFASRAARLAARWLLAEGLASEVEVRIHKGNVESQRVAAAAGFTPAGTVVSRVAATGETFEDLRFVMLPDAGQTPLALPRNLVDAVRVEDDERRRAWMTTLPGVIEHLERHWSLSVGRPFQPGGQTAWVAPARSKAGSDVVLKLAWRHGEAEHEAEALRAWDGQGAVSLHAAEELDGTIALLLERCTPGTPLASRPEPEQDTVIASLLPRLWREPAPGHVFRPLEQMCEAWADEFERKAADRPMSIDPGLAREGIALFRTLPATAERNVLLCTDLHAENVLASRREPWLAIDPKPYVGDPTYDALQHLLNCDERLHADPRALALRMAGLLGLDAERLLLWLFARCVQESLDWPALADVARSVAPT